MSILTWYLWLIPLTLLHECGHAFAGRILGFRVFWISVGYGRQIFDKRIFGLNVRINALPFGGMTVLASKTSSNLRLRIWLSIFAGPATHLALLGACFFILGLDFFRDRVLTISVLDRIAPVEMFIYANAFLLLSNLFTKRAEDRVGFTYGDGYQLLRIPFLKSQELEEHRISYFALEALEHIRSGRTEQAILLYENALKLNPQNQMLRHCLAVARLEQGDLEYARAELVDLLESDEGHEVERRPLLLNNIAWTNVVLGKDELLQEADDYSEEALRFAPKLTCFIGTRGAVLVMTGRIQEGLGLLKTAFRHHSERSSRSSTAVWIAIGSAQMGDLSEATKWLQRAREESPGHYLLDMAEQRVKAACPLSDVPLN